jgi:hypothetical protein
MNAGVRLITYGDLHDLIFKILDEYQGPMHQRYDIDDEDISTVLLIVLENRSDAPTIN